MNSIEAYIQFEDGLIGEDGDVSDESTREFLRTTWQSLTVSSRECIQRCLEVGRLRVTIVRMLERGEADDPHQSSEWIDLHVRSVRVRSEVQNCALHT